MNTCRSSSSCPSGTSPPWCSTGRPSSAPRTGRSTRSTSTRDDRPAAWLDDNIDETCVAWAEGRSAPTLIVETKPSEGLTDEHVTQLLALGRRARGLDPLTLNHPGQTTKGSDPFGSPDQVGLARGHRRRAFCLHTPGIEAERNEVFALGPPGQIGAGWWPMAQERPTGAPRRPDGPRRPRSTSRRTRRRQRRERGPSRSTTRTGYRRCGLAAAGSAGSRPSPTRPSAPPPIRVRQARARPPMTVDRRRRAVRDPLRRFHERVGGRRPPLAEANTSTHDGNRLSAVRAGVRAASPGRASTPSSARNFVFA